MSAAKQAWASVVLGLVALVAVPLGAFLGEHTGSLDLLRSIMVAVGTSFLCGLVGVSTVRRARFRLERSLTRSGERTLRVGRLLVFLGLYLASVGAIALAFYGIVLAFS